MIPNFIIGYNNSKILLQKDRIWPRNNEEILPPPQIKLPADVSRGSFRASFASFAAPRGTQCWTLPLTSWVPRLCHLFPETFCLTCFHRDQFPILTRTPCMRYLYPHPCGENDQKDSPGATSESEGKTAKIWVWSHSYDAGGRVENPPFHPGGPWGTWGSLARSSGPHPCVLVAGAVLALGRPNSHWGFSCNHTISWFFYNYYIFILIFISYFWGSEARLFMDTWYHRPTWRGPLLSYTAVTPGIPTDEFYFAVPQRAAKR